MRPTVRISYILLVHLLFPLETRREVLGNFLISDRNEGEREDEGKPAEDIPLDTDSAKDLEPVNIMGLAGSSIGLPCDLVPQIPGDDLLLVLWYKIGLASPVYTFDVRDRSIGSARHYSDKTLFDEPTRAVMRAVPEPSALVISNLIPGDEGLYKCRADFRSSPTKHNLVNLTIIAPPHPPTVYDEEGRRVVDSIGPVLAGGQLVATCVSNGGKPEPNLTWSRGPQILKREFERVNGQTVNTVTIKRLQREDQGSRITCSASNNNQSTAVSTSVKIEVAYPPELVKIEDKPRTMLSGEEYRFTCRALNSSGSTKFRWFIGQQELFEHSEAEDTRPYTWISVLRYTASWKDDLSYISCSAVNQIFPSISLEDGFVLDIKYTPILSIEFGRSLDVHNIQSGDDVYFVCKVKSNPRSYNLTWRQNGKFLMENITAGIIFGNHTLVLQSVDRTRSGLYTCIGSNSVGDGESNALSLDVKYTPVCDSSSKSIVQMNIGDTKNIVCKVFSNPDPARFYWSFLNSNKSAVQEINSKERKISYRVESADQYGTVRCAAENSIGLQEEFCAFNITPPISPGLLRDCEVSNISYQSVEIHCTGLQHIEPGLVPVLDITFWGIMVLNGEIIKKIQVPSPEFRFTNLEPDQVYSFSLYPQSIKGYGPYVTMNVTTLKMDGKQLASKIDKSQETSQSSSLDSTTILGITLGLCGTLSVTAIALLIGLRKKSNRQRPYHTVTETGGDWDRTSQGSVTTRSVGSHGSLGSRGGLSQVSIGSRPGERRESVSSRALGRKNLLKSDSQEMMVDARAREMMVEDSRAPGLSTDRPSRKLIKCKQQDDFKSFQESLNLASCGEDIDHENSTSNPSISFKLFKHSQGENCQYGSLQRSFRNQSTAAIKSTHTLPYNSGKRIKFRDPEFSTVEFTSENASNSTTIESLDDSFLSLHRGAELTPPPSKFCDITIQGEEVNLPTSTPTMQTFNPNSN